MGADKVALYFRFILDLGLILDFRSIPENFLGRYCKRDFAVPACIRKLTAEGYLCH